MHPSQSSTVCSTLLLIWFSLSNSCALRLTQVAAITNPSPGILARFDLPGEVTRKIGSRNECCYTLQKNKKHLELLDFRSLLWCVLLHFAAVLFSANLHDALHVASKFPTSKGCATCFENAQRSQRRRSQKVALNCISSWVQTLPSPNLGGLGVRKTEVTKQVSNRKIENILHLVTMAINRDFLEASQFLSSSESKILDECQINYKFLSFWKTKPCSCPGFSSLKFVLLSFALASQLPQLGWSHQRTNQITKKSRSVMFQNVVGENYAVLKMLLDHYWHYWTHAWLMSNFPRWAVSRLLAIYGKRTWRSLGLKAAAAIFCQKTGAQSWSKHVCWLWTLIRLRPSRTSSLPQWQECQGAEPLTLSFVSTCIFVSPGLSSERDTGAVLHHAYLGWASGVYHHNCIPLKATSIQALCAISFQ